MSSDRGYGILYVDMNRDARPGMQFGMCIVCFLARAGVRFGSLFRSVFCYLSHLIIVVTLVQVPSL